MRMLFPALMASLMLAADEPGEAKNELMRIEGTWLVMEVKANGKQIPQEVIKQRRETLTFKDGKMTQRTAKPEENIGSYKIDPTKKPKTIDLMGDAKSSVGIYELRDDSLRICLRQGGRERPKEFAAKEGSESVLITLKRHKR